MDAAIGPGQKYSTFGWSAYFVSISKISQLVRPGVSDVWVFMDEQPDAMDDSILYADVSPNAMNLGNGEFTEMPAAYHNNSCGISFADGHAECHHWMNSQTIVPVSYKAHNVPLNQQVPVSGDKDLQWLALHTPHQ
jgi:prepilin-type processing-associated H-X9-DG protein